MKIGLQGYAFSDLVGAIAMTVCVRVLHSGFLSLKLSPARVVNRANALFCLLLMTVAFCSAQVTPHHIGTLHAVPKHNQRYWPFRGGMGSRHADNDALWK